MVRANYFRDSLSGITTHIASRIVNESDNNKHVLNIIALIT